MKIIGQPDLFGTATSHPHAPMPPGWACLDGFIGTKEEVELLEAITAMPLKEARYKAYTAKRRIASFGSSYDFDTNQLLPTPPIPASLLGLRAEVAAWSGLPADAFDSALVTEYRPGTPLGWHRDVPDFEVVVGVSLAGSARMRLRRYPPLDPKKADVISVELPPRSAYRLQDEVRWAWQHSIAPTGTLRYSITFRTRSARRSAERRPAAAWRA
jgi:alkylated DNA repair dioxygenase AlkB